MREPGEGLRPYARRIDPGTLAAHVRIVALGDSITHGMSLQQEETYPHLLSRLLQSHCRGQTITVVNAGIAGQTAVQGYQRLWRDVIRYRPHVTLIAFGLNDTRLRRRQQDAFREREMLPPGAGALLSRLHTYRTLKSRLRQVTTRLGLSSPIDYDAQPIAEARSSPAAFRAALWQMVNQIKRHAGGDVWLLTTHPVISRYDDAGHSATPDSRSDAIRLHYNEIVRELAGELSVGLIDVERSFPEGASCDLRQSDGVHLTAAGQRFLAELIAEKLLMRGLPCS